MNAKHAFYPAAIALAASLLAACAEKPKPAPEVARYTIEEFLGNTTVRGASFSPGGDRILVSSDESGVFNAYAIPVDGGAPVQLTHSADSVFTVSYFPDDDRFLYLADQGGNELSHLYVRNPDGSSEDLTPGENLKAAFMDWADDDASFYVISNERDPKYFDIYEYASDDYSREMMYRNDAGLQPALVSPDERFVALVKSNTTSDSDIVLLDRETGETENLTANESVADNSPEAFSKDSRYLYFTSNEGAEFASLRRMDLDTGEREILLAPEWDVVYAYLSETGKYLVAGINKDARTELNVFETASMQPVALPVMPDAEITSVSISKDETRMAFYASSSRVPRDLFVMDIGGGEPRQLTDTLNAAINPADLVDAEIVRFKSYDGLEIPGILYKPHGASAGNKVPALVWVHGGPGGQSRVGYSSLIQYLVNHGYAVYAINNRGSSGYGKTFFNLDNRKHGEADLGDVVASKQMLIGLGYVDPERIGIIGGSYGGYMVLAAQAFEPGAFKVGVDIFGVANWLRTLESIPPWWESFREALYAELGDPATDRERLRRISPLFHAGNIVDPLLVLQGANDPRVLKVESDEIVAAVKANGVPVEYVVFEDEGHGFRKKENQARGWKAVLDFLDMHLKGETAKP
ncbi:MAG TPA: alpha/beta fold hydrolase [Gammaproteobacteria bacterium]